MHKYLSSLTSQVQGLDAPVVKWGGIFIFLIMAWSLLLMPYLEWREQRLEMLHMQIAKVERLQALQSVAGQWELAEGRFSESFEKLKTLFFQGSSYAGAQTDRLKLIQPYMKKHHLVVKSQRLIDSEVDLEIGEIVAVKFGFQGNLVDVLSFVDALSHDPHLLLADSLSISHLRNDQALLQLTLRGYRLSFSGENAK